MKVGVAILMIVCMLSGCKSANVHIDQVTDLRKNILEADSCSFETVITADYGNAIYTFQMKCNGDRSGNLEFTVTDPDTISGISGEISQNNAALTFDDRVLAFPMLANGQIPPVSAPWFFLNALRGGYLSACSEMDDGICIYIDDSFEQTTYQVQVYMDEDTLPVRAEIIWQGQRILTLEIREFQIQ